ncbi:MARTX multifunctional-autoprocessing repeats-in-toxin holotoxin RtxA [Psychromonas sp. Urea-02u-13]|uniref:MARTX multifunctional-autoprocessing repeats-in-toxin holotoxin RtxA n=1 Tax=Psychromonas sp. Urea-02u-13 TaxID=2058326 RepID=UPI000C338D0E|nr:MARTX multifunctional-autoprocessing repeats-in-toxin holotoxin RtxA [Psychromonas sp. Urea-02u-13]PKG38877.1 MARTX multifunctional-autoprocessing repeats-in-toxin holotoxin RtxA [Psychromonas sp. Urea-02u-13]
MGKPFWRSVEYFFTGNYSADAGNNNIVAIGFGGAINAYGGDDTITVGSIGASVNTGSGNDKVYAGAAYLKVEDSTGNLDVYGAAGYADINKNGDGNVSFAGATGGGSIDHTGNHGNVKYSGVAAYNALTRKGLSGDVTFEGVGGHNRLWHETNQGNLNFAGAGAGNKLDRTWFNRYQGSSGDISFNGIGAANSISSRVETGNISFQGAGADNQLVRKGKVGDITFQGAGASNRIERTRQADDVYSETRGDIQFEGIGAYNSIYSDVAHGDINFSGAGAYNEITRKGTKNDFEGKGLEDANANEIVLTSANLGGNWIKESQAVNGVKSTTEANTYLFAFADATYTKISKVKLHNDPVTGKLSYYATSWYKKGNHLTNLADQQISSENGFANVNRNGAYTLSKLNVDHQQSVTVHAIEKNLTEYEWITYGGGTSIDAADVTLSDSKMGGPSISTIGTTIDVKAVKSNRNPNTYIYASLQGPHTKIVVVELANDPESGELKYRSIPWYKTGDYTANIADENISAGNGYKHAGYSLSDLQYSVDTVRVTSDQIADMEEYSEKPLIEASTDSGESSGDVRFIGAGGGNVIKSNVTQGNVYFDGAGIANVIIHSSDFGNTDFNGIGSANVIVKSGLKGDLTFHGAGFGNVLVHQSQQGKMDVWAGGLANVLVRVGDGEYLAHLLAYGNTSVQQGNGDSRVMMFGGYNTHTQIGNGSGTWVAAGGFNVMTQVGDGDITSVLVGGANVLSKIGDGDLTSGMLGGANIMTHISSDDQSSDTTSVALGGLNVLTKKGKGNALAVMAGGGNVLTHIGDGNTTGVMIGGANVLTKVGNGDTTGIMLGLGNVLTHIGSGQTLGVMGAVGNVFTKMGDGAAIAAMVGAANIFTHIGEGDSWALMGGLGNVFTKIGDGNALALMIAEVNVFTHIGNGNTVALMLAKGNIATKVGNGMTMAAMVGNANVFTHVGDGETFAAMIGQANILTKVGNDLTAALMVGKANIYTHVGDGTSLGIFAGEANIMTKVGDGTTLAAMFGKANVMTHVGGGLTGVLALGEANIVTKVGDGFMGVVAAAKANVVTHVGNATTAAVLLGEGNILTKVGDGTTVGLLISKIGNIMTHVGDGMTIGVAKGKANVITKVGDGLGVNVAWGEANILTHIGDGDRYNFAKGAANIITKVGDGQEVSVVHGKANIITHVGDGDDYTGAWGEANIITKVGDGRNVVLAKGDANIVTQIGDGDSFNALWSEGNIVTKVGDGMQVTAAKGKANIVTTIGNGLSVTATYGDLNINTKVGDGISVNVAWGKYNINTKVGDGLNVAVMKGKANANIQVGDGLGINASYAQHNVAIKIGNGDFYSLSVASSNTKSNKLSSLFANIKQTVLGMAGSQGINFLVQGDDASASGYRKGRGAIATPEITQLNGFQMEEIAEVGSELGDNMSGGVTDVETPDVAAMKSELNVDEDTQSTENLNLITNGDFEQGAQGWLSTNGIEASYSGSVYGVDNTGHGAIVNELATHVNTTIYQDIQRLESGEVLSLSFDFVQRAGLSAGHGMQVLWNGSIVFSASGDESTWQQQTLQLKAQAGSNRIEFKGTGESNGLGYILDNVVAKSDKIAATSAVSDNAEQNKAAANALSDKEKAEADAQRLQQEKDQQLAALSDSQEQLEATDEEALKTNGQAEREALAAEQRDITKELTDLTQGLDALDDQNNYQGESGDSWRDNFAGGILDNVQSKLDDAKLNSNEQLDKAAQQNKQNQQDAQVAVIASESGVAKGEENQANAQQEINDAKANANSRQDEAVVSQQDALQAKTNANAGSNQAQQRGEQDSTAAKNKVLQAQADAKATKQDEDDKPDRNGVSGSGLSGKAYEAQAAAENANNVDVHSEVAADGRYSEGLTEQELDALEGAKEAVNRLQINAGVRIKNTGTSVTDKFSNASSHKPMVSDVVTFDEVRRNEQQVSGVNLQGLGDVLDMAIDPKNAEIFDSKGGFDGFGRVAGLVEPLATDEPRLLKYHKLDTENVSQDTPKTELMSVADLLETAYVKGKIRGESYQKVIDALAHYHTTSGDNVDSEMDAMVNLRQQVEGYLLGHPDSGRVSALNVLLSQVSQNIEVGDSSVYQDTFSTLYAQLDNANINDSKHLYIDVNGGFVTKGKENITDAQKLASGKLAVDKLKSAVVKEYGQAIADAVFNDFQKNGLAKDSKGVDVEGLKKVHRAIEQQLSPVSATLFIWKPSGHSSLGHAAMQIGQGRVQVDAQDTPDFNQKNYVSWWPQRTIPTNPEQNISKNDFNFNFNEPAFPHNTLESDIFSKKNATSDKFGMESGDDTLSYFIKTLNAAKSSDAQFKDISAAYTAIALNNPDMLDSLGLPDHVSRRFVDEWNDTSNDMMDVAKRFAEELQKQTEESSDEAAMEKRISNIVREFADRALKNINDFKAQEANLGKVFRINLEGLDVAAMQAEWNKLSNDADPRFKLLTNNCSTIVAKVLKAGGADKLIGHTWTPNVGVWTPTVLFNYGQALQEAQLEIAAKKQSRHSIDDVDVQSGKDKLLESVVMENDDNPPRDKASLSPLTRFLNNRLYGSKDVRREIGYITQASLDRAVTDEKSVKVTLKGKSGRLSGYYHHGDTLEDTGQTQETAHKVVLFVHGAGSSAEEQANAVRQHYQKQGIDMLAVNMRGYGASDGGPNEKGLYQDARTMFSYLVNDKGIEPGNIIIHGYSLGGPIAADLARFAAQNNKAVSGLLLDRPMPSMTKALTAHEEENPAGIVGSLSKIVNGQFSVEKNLKGLPKETPIMLLTDNDALADEGEKLRAKLTADGYQVSGENTIYGHQASNRLMSQYAKEIVVGLFDTKPQTVDEGYLLGHPDSDRVSDPNALLSQETQNIEVGDNTVSQDTFSTLEDRHQTEGENVVPDSLTNREESGDIDRPYQSRDLLLEPIKPRETIELGMPEADQKVLADIAERENVIIAVRPVDEKSKSLIASKMYSSKGLFVKAKSSDWGPMSGFIPVDQSFAKGSARRELDKFNAYAQQSINTGNAVSADLYLNDVRVHELVSKYHSLTSLELDAESGMYKTTATNGEQSTEFFLKKVTVDDGELWQVHYLKDGELAPFKVIGDPVSKQPMTADYDLLTVMHSYGDLGPKDKVKQPMTWEQWKDSVTYEDLSLKQKALFDSEALFTKKDGESLGIVSDRLKELKDVINTGLGRNNGLEMVHHGADDANPYAVMADNFPATFFVPKSFFAEDGLGDGKGAIQTYFNVNDQGAVVISNPQEFSNFQQVAINANYRASLNEKWNEGLADPLFTKKRKLSHDYLDARDVLAKKLNGEVISTLSNTLNPDSKLEQLNGHTVNNQNVESWNKVTVTPQDDGGDTRFDGQLIIQTENDSVATKAAADLAGKHPDSSVVVQLDADGKYRVVYGDPSQLSGKLRWQIVGHGRDESDNNNTRLSGYSATELAANLVQFSEDFSLAKKISSKPEYISIVGCSLISTDKQKGFAQTFITVMAESDIRVDVSARSSEVAVDATGRKHTRDADEQWAQKLVDNKVVLSWNDQGDVTVREEAVRNTIAEGDIDLSRVGLSDNDTVARGAIADNADVFTAPEKRKNKIEMSSSDKSDNKVSYSGNIQVNVGDGEFTALNWGTSNVGIKVGTGGFKSLAFGDNNVMVHIGNGDSKHSVDMGGYQALEGAQMFIGNRNVSFNMGRSNDLIVMMDKSIPTPPLVNPFDGAARISGVLQNISESGKDQDWLVAQDSQWTLAGAHKFVKDMSGLDQTSSVDYTTLVNLDSQHERSSRGLKSDTEATLNKKYNEWLSGNKGSDSSKMSRSDQFRQKNEELAFNLAVGGRGADIQVTTGNWNFMFGDNIHSILDTNLGSLFGLMTQQFSASGKAGTTFTYNPQDLPRQLKNKLLGKLAGVGANTTLADIFAVDYTADGQIIARNGEAVDSVAILTEMVEVVAEFGGEQLKSFVNPSALLDSLKSSLDMGKDGLTTFVESHGLKDKAPEELENESAVSVSHETDGQVKPATIDNVADKEERPFGFNALNLPNLFATIFSSDKQSEMKSLVTNLKDNLTADLLNMKEATFDFLRNSGHLQGDGDVNVSLGNYNFNWGGDGKDLGAYLGDNNNFWGGRGDDVYYATGTSNIFTGGEGNDMGVLMGRENMMFGGDGDDTAVVAGRINHVFMGDGNDQAFVFGEGGTIESGSGRDYVVTSGNYNSVQAGGDQDYVVTIGNNNQIDLGHGDDFSNVFGNYNRIDGKAGNDVIKLMGYHAVIDAGADDDHLIATSVSKFSELDGGEGNDLLVLGGYSNTFLGGTGIDSFMINDGVIDNQVTDISKEDFIIFNDLNWNDLWLQRSGSDLQIQINRKMDYSSDQAKFESMGSVTFSDYFSDNRAELVISMGDKQQSGERDYIALSNDAVDNLVQAMSGFAPLAGDAGLIDPLGSNAKHNIALAWGNVNKGSGHLA